MSFEHMKKRDIEIDEFNIKSHLNASLEAEGINVSEDLIRRTMDAIRLQDAKGSDDAMDIYRHNRPVFNRHARTLVTVAAAALILIAGLSALRTISPLGMKGQSKSDNSVAYDNAGEGKTERFSATERAPEENTTTYKYDKADTEDYKTADAIAEDGTDDKQDEEVQALGTIMGFDDVENEEKKGESPADSNKLTSSVVYMLSSFTDISLIEAAEVKEIKVSSQATSDMSIISDIEQIEAFYSVMDKYSFQQNTEADTEADTDIHYVVNIISGDRESQISIGDATIVVDNVRNEAISHSTFSTVDHALLIKDLNDFLGF